MKSFMCCFIVLVDYSLIPTFLRMFSDNGFFLCNTFPPLLNSTVKSIEKLLTIFHCNEKLSIV